jgi:triacylglycerol esterase/lipase EstA (alpha/beta hydrolase family)
MLSRHVRLGLLVELAAWVAIGSWLVLARRWDAASAVALAVAVVLGARLAVVATSFAMSTVARSRRETQHRLGPAATVRLVAGEWRAMLANNFYWLPFEKQALRPDPPLEPAGLMPVVLVHGYLSNRGTLCRLARALDAAGAGPVFVPTLPAIFQPIERFEEHLCAAIEAICRATGQPKVVLVAHSMGGLVSRQFLMRRGNARVARLVTLGSPHHGTAIAPLGLGANAVQMRIGSDFLAGLAKREGESGPGIPALSVWTAHDNLVAPQDSSRLAWARAAPIHGVAHLAMLDDSRVHRLVLAEIAAARAG